MLDETRIEELARGMAAASINALTSVAELARKDSTFDIVGMRDALIEMMVVHYHSELTKLVEALEEAVQLRLFEQLDTLDTLANATPEAPARIFVDSLLAMMRQTQAAQAAASETVIETEAGLMRLIDDDQGE